MTTVSVGAKHLALFDGLNLIRRVYSANQAPDSAEKVQQALKASAGSIRRALEEIRPTHAVFVLDPEGNNFRHRLYPAYKQNRKPMFPGLRDGLADFSAQIESRFGMRTVIAEDVEADDVITTLAIRWLERVKAEPALFQAPTIVSTDKDLAVLIADGARIRHHFNKEWRDASWVREHFGIEPHQLHDLLSLAGDTTDNIPGIPGVALKTAAKLLKTYGTLEGVLSATDIKGKLGETVVLNGETARLSSDLVSMRRDLTLGLTWSQFKLKPLPV